MELQSTGRLGKCAGKSETSDILPEEPADAAGLALESGRVLRVLEGLQVAVLLDGLSLDGSFAIGEHLLGDGDERRLGRGGFRVLDGGTERGADEHKENESCTASHFPGNWTTNDRRTVTSPVNSDKMLFQIPYLWWGIEC